MENIISVDLSTSTAPVVSETRGKQWISYGDNNGEWANLYPQFLIDLYYSSSITAAIVNATAEMIAGENLVITDEEDRDVEARVKLQDFMNNANSNETLHEVLKKVAFDFKLQGAFALNIVWSKDRTEIAEIHHIPVEKIRCERPDEFGKTRGYYVSGDWANIRTNKPYRVPAFNVNDRTSPNQILYTGLYSPNMNSYYTADYISCNNWSLIDSKVSEYHLQNVSNSFSGSFLISFANGVPTQDARRQIEQSITEKFTGTNAGKFILTFSDDKTRTPEISAISPSDLDKQYIALQELLTSNILSGHRVTSKTLMGLDSTNGFSSNADELLNASNFYLNTVVMPFQGQILKVLHKIFQVNNMDMPVHFVQLKPITIQFDSKTIREVMSQDEIREEIGLPPLGDGVVADEDLTQMAEYSALDECIDAYGEDLPKDYEIIKEENAEDEVEDFDFEAELNANYYEFASTGSAYPNRKSKQDQKTKQTEHKDDIYRVRYRYAGSRIGERKFCKKMVAANKIYRKEDIIAMGTKPVNKGWGEYGANTYSVWKWKGGALCEHKWFRIILVQKGKTPKNSDSIISSTAAKSRGVKLPRNAKEVSVAPHDMPNHGFVNPELIAKYKNV
tara:strand:+ start:3085 stop:4941 length:1857 start_codon:yes stop_codon:yes gene_type:complete